MCLVMCLVNLYNVLSCADVGYDGSGKQGFTGADESIIAARNSKNTNE